MVGALAARAETLSQLTQEALRNNPEFRVLEATVVAALGGVTTAKTWQNPELSVGPGVRENVATSGPPKPGFNATFELNQLFLFPGKRQLLIAIAQRNVEISKLALEGFRFQLTTAGRKAFYEYLAAEKIVKLHQDQIQSAQTFYDAAVKRAQAGFASDFETVKSQADLINARKLARAAEGNVTTARVEFNTLLGRASWTFASDRSPRGTVPKNTVEGYVGLGDGAEPESAHAGIAGESCRFEFAQNALRPAAGFRHRACNRV